MSEKRVKSPAADWQVRLIDERSELLSKVIAIKKALDNKDFKLNHDEWQMLSEQYCAMREYLRALTQRCRYYDLIDAEPLDIY